MEQERLLTTQEAAERLGLTDSRVRQLVLEGRSPAQKFGHLNMIREQDLQLVSNIKRGRPPKVNKKASAKKNKIIK
jgi:excisionase family DNA binding protein